MTTALLLAYLEGLYRSKAQVLSKRLVIISGAESLVIGLDPGLFFPIQRRVTSGDRILRRPLKHVEMFGFLRNHGNGLNTGRPGANHSNPFSGKLDSGMGPIARVVPLPLEVCKARSLRNILRGQTTRSHDAKLGRHLVSGVRLDRPRIRGLVKDGASDARVELDIFA